MENAALSSQPPRTLLHSNLRVFSSWCAHLHTDKVTLKLLRPVAAKRHLTLQKEHYKSKPPGVNSPASGSKRLISLDLRERERERKKVSVRLWINKHPTNNPSGVNRGRGGSVYRSVERERERGRERERRRGHSQLTGRLRGEERRGDSHGVQKKTSHWTEHSSCLPLPRWWKLPRKSLAACQTGSGAKTIMMK